MLIAIVGLSLLATALGQQCPSIDGLRSEQWLLDRAAEKGNGGPPPFPSYAKVIRVFAGAHMSVCDQYANFPGAKPHVAETLCTYPGRGQPCQNITICSPNQAQVFSYPFWSDLLDIRAQAAKNPSEFGGEKRTDVKACLTCYALAKPPIPQFVGPKDVRKNSVTVSTRLACGKNLQNARGQPRFGPNAAERQQLDQLAARLASCATQPRPECASLGAQRENFLRSFQLFNGDEPVTGHKDTLVEIPYDQARVFQTEVTLDSVEGAILTQVPLPAGLNYPQGVQPNTCSAFEYGMVVVSPGRVATACWMTPMFGNAAARKAYVDSEYAAEEAIVTAKRRAEAKQCRQLYSDAKRALDSFQRQRQFNPRAAPDQQSALHIFRTIPACVFVCNTAKATLPANHNFLVQPKAFPDLCTNKYLKLNAQLAQLNG